LRLSARDAIFTSFRHRWRLGVVKRNNVVEMPNSARSAKHSNNRSERDRLLAQKQELLKSVSAWTER
jgi:hypothetical protein